MSLKDKFRRFLGAIGIIIRPDDSENAEDDGQDFSNDGSDYRGAYDSAGQNGSYRAHLKGMGGGNPRQAQYADADADAYDSGNVIEFKNIHRHEPSYSEPKRPQTVIHYLRDLSDCKQIISDLLDGCQVVLNIEDADESVTQRVIDVIYGASYALRADMRRTSRMTFIIAPSTVELNYNKGDDGHGADDAYGSNVRSFRS